MADGRWQGQIRLRARVFEHSKLESQSVVSYSKAIATVACARSGLRASTRLLDIHIDGFVINRDEYVCMYVFMGREC
jgi:hypothetical protein